MTTKRNREVNLPTLDELFSTQAERDDAKLKRIYEIPLEEIDPFPDHPFKVKDDEEMMELVESVRTNGIITPAIVRKKEDGRYELISGHRRKRACEIAGIETLRADIVEMTHDEAVVYMVEANFSREEILPSEKGFSYKMRLEAMKRLPGRPKKNSAPVAPDLERSDVELGKQIGESRDQIRRYIRLTELIPELLELVDQKQIALRPAVELSYLSKESQRHLLYCIDMFQCTPSHAQAIKLRKMDAEGALDVSIIEIILSELKPNQKEGVVIKSTKIKNLFPANLPVEKREEYIIAAMKFYGEHMGKRK